MGNWHNSRLGLIDLSQKCYTLIVLCATIYMYIYAPVAMDHGKIDKNHMGQGKRLTIEHVFNWIVE